MSQPTLRQVAEAAGVSSATVSMSLRHDPRISELTRKKVQEVAREMGYVPNSAMREAMIRVRSSEKAAVGETLVWLTNHQHRELFHLAEGFAREQGFHLEIFQINSGNSRDLIRLQRLIKARGVRGMLVDQLGASPVYLDPEYFRDLRIVSLEEGMAVREGVCRVLPDVGEMVREAMKTAYERGYRRPGLMFNHWMDKEMRLRHHFVGLQTAMNMWTQDSMMHVSNQTSKSVIRTWVEKNKFDVLICDLNMHVQKLLEAGVAQGMPGLVLLQEWDGTISDQLSPLQIQVPDRKWMEVAVSQLVAMVQHGPGWELFSVGTQFIPPSLIQGDSLPEREFSGSDQEKFRNLPGKNGRFLPVSMSKVVNQGFAGMSGWFGEIPQLAFLPGRRICAGVPFEVQEGPTNFLAMRSAHFKLGQRGTLPESVEIELPAAENCDVDSILILHTCAYVENTKPFARYRLHTASGSVSEERVCTVNRAQEHELPEKIPSDAKVQDWWVGAPRFSTSRVKPISIAHMEPLDEFSGNFYVWRWKNPFPGETLTRLEVVSDLEQQATLGVLGVTMFVREG